MSGFDAKEGLVHFLFAEPDDYYLESLLKLDLMQFLYYSIKSQEYDGIYFLKQENTVKTFLGSKEEISVYCLDQKSVDEFPAETGYLGGQVARSDTVQGKYRMYGIRGRKEIMTSRIQMMIKKDQNYAFVMPLNMMKNLLHTGTFRDTLLNAVNENKDNMMIVLTASKAAENSFGELCSLAQEEPFLFKEIADILKSKEKLSFYQNMKLKYGDRMQVWNQMDLESILSMVHRMVLSGEFQGDESRWKEYADLLYIYASDPAVRAELRPFMEKGASRYLRAMRKSLDSGRTWDKLNQMVVESDGSWKEKALRIRKIRGLRYPVFMKENSTINAMNGLRKELEKQSAEYGIRWDENYKKVQRIMNHVRTPWNVSNDYEDIENYAAQCVIQIEKYADLYLLHTPELRYSPVTMILNDIWYKIAYSGTPGETEEIQKEKQKTFDATIRMSVNFMECLNNYDRQKQEMDTLIEELKQNLEQKENFKSSMYEGMENSPLVSDQKHKLKEFDTNIAHAEEWIRRYQKSNEALLYNIQKLKDMLDAANLGLTQLTGSGTTDMKELLGRLNSLNDLVQKQMAESNITGQEPDNKMDELFAIRKVEVHKYGI